MRPRDSHEAQRLGKALDEYEQHEQPLPGIRPNARRQALIEQILESIRRVKYVTTIAQREISPSRADPTSELFDPIRAAIKHHLEGRTDEAYWLVFLSVHFGRNIRSGWRLVRDVYGRLGTNELSDWDRTSTDPAEFREWLGANESLLKPTDNVRRGFGNHRKYQSLSATKPNGTGAAIASYVEWVSAYGGHPALIEDASEHCEGDPRAMFDLLFHSMEAVISFGRTARFDYLTMLAKVGLAPIEPGSTYMSGATGPRKGAEMLFGAAAGITRLQLDEQLVKLGDHLGIGMQVVEDSLCNWQKSPSDFRPFRG